MGLELFWQGLETTKRRWKSRPHRGAIIVSSLSPATKSSMWSKTLSGQRKASKLCAGPRAVLQSPCGQKHFLMHGPKREIRVAGFPQMWPLFVVEMPRYKSIPEIQVLGPDSLKFADVVFSLRLDDLIGNFPLPHPLRDQRNPRMRRKT